MLVFEGVGCELILCAPNQECIEDEDGNGKCVDSTTPGCPVEQPSPWDSCNWEGSCCWGSETCCGETFDSFCCSCTSTGQAACFYTDACLGGCEPGILLREK